MFVPDRHRHSCAHDYLPSVSGMRTFELESDAIASRHCERSEAIQNPSAERLWIVRGARNDDGETDVRDTLAVVARLDRGI